MKMFDIKNMVHEYFRRDEEGNVTGITTAVDKVSLQVAPGDFIAILGHNGSGKSTLAKHLNAILYPSEGTVLVDGMDTKEEDKLMKIRQTTGMVFQNPDNQIIAQVVEEDVGFGPENLGVPTEEIWQRMEESLKAVGMYEYRKKSPNRLSGGQKQRVSIAGVLAMHPKCIVLDEPTAMLDPGGRREVIRAARALNDVEGITVMLITHYMEEVIHADHVYVMDHGKVVMEGTPKEVFSRVEELQKLRLSVPQSTLLADRLKKAGLPLPDGILSRKELVEELKKLPMNRSGKAGRPGKANSPEKPLSPEGETDQKHAIIIDHLSHEYESGTAMAVKALSDVSLTIPKGQFVGLIGHTGSGKSSLIQHLNGLLKPTEGTVYIDGEDIFDKDYDLKKLRSRVGLVFQYPEHQLFEVDVFTDVCFGPKNLGLDQKEVELRAYEALKKVGFDDDSFYVSPFDLSGGQKRRVAIAGVLAMKPDVMILDEPTAGLDPKGRDEILDLIKQMQKETGMTVILVSHSMEDVANYVDRIVVMNKGSVMLDGSPGEIFTHVSELEEAGLAVPEVTYIVRDLNKEGFGLPEGVTTIKEAADAILALTGG